MRVILNHLPGEELLELRVEALKFVGSIIAETFRARSERGFQSHDLDEGGSRSHEFSMSFLRNVAISSSEKFGTERVWKIEEELRGSCQDKNCRRCAGRGRYAESLTLNFSPPLERRMR